MGARAAEPNGSRCAEDGMTGTSQAVRAVGTTPDRAGSVHAESRFDPPPAYQPLVLVDGAMTGQISICRVDAAEDFQSDRTRKPNAGKESWVRKTRTPLGISQ